MGRLNTKDSHGRGHGPGDTRGLGAPPAGPEQSVGEIEKLLASAAWKTYRRLFGALECRSEPVPFDLGLVIHPGSRWRVAAQPPLAEQLARIVREMAAREDVHRPGRVYCYRCESAACEHGVPPEPDRVFGGYTATGLPFWPPLIQVMLEQRHPETAALYEDRGNRLAAAFMDSGSLRLRQLDVFGRQSKTYDIVAQLVFGFLRLPLAGVDGLESLAVTLQAVEVRRSSGRARLVLNVIGRLSDGSPVSLHLEGHRLTKVLGVINTLRQRLLSLAPDSDRHSGPDAAARARVEGIFRDAVKALERLGRQSQRRTAHAEERRDQSRPTAKALQEAMAAPADRILWDDRNGTLVILGSRNRVHIFNPQGRHVTSIIMEAEEIMRRRRRQRWQRAAADTLEGFRTALGNRPGG